MIKLRPMTEDEFDAYLAVRLPDYAQEHAKAGNWSPDEAMQRAEEQLRQLLPDGLATKNHDFFVVEAKETGDDVGMLWLAVREQGETTKAFVFDVQIYEPFRRQGYGSATFRAMEEKVEALGLDTIALHVFGSNYPAREMYKKLGYVETDVIMAKRLAN
ncbi:MAG: GNAT family N-acetyltransferase [Anaerolineae bacterium]|nr:GNAT family N-acetyltransferase [Anaerolineae bacterium]